MRLGRAIDIQHKLVTSVIDLYSMAESCGMTSAAINEAYLKLFERYPKLPHHVTAYVSGYRAALSDALYYTAVFHAYEWNGQLYERWESYPEELKEHIRHTPSDQLVSGHYWRGSNKPYFVNQPKQP